MSDVTCQQCGETFKRARRGPKPKWCRACRYARTLALVAAHNASKRVEPKLHATCQDCGSMFGRTSPNGPLPKRCEGCKKRHQRDKAIEARRQKHDQARAQGRMASCGDCGNEFRHSYKGPTPARCPECTSSHQAAKYARRYPDRAPRNCSDCGVVVTQRRKGPLRERCEDCALRRQKAQVELWSLRHPTYLLDKRRRHGQRRRAAKRAVPIEFFSHREIFVRDGWLCQICGHKIDPGVKYPDPRSASLDHIIPLSKRGPHTRANVRLACLSCNLEKSDKMPA